MQAISYSTALKNMAKTMECVCDNHEPIIITRTNAPAVVIMTLEDFNAIQETIYLLQNPAGFEKALKKPGRVKS